MSMGEFDERGMARLLEAISGRARHDAATVMGGQAFRQIAEVANGLADIDPEQFAWHPGQLGPDGRASDRRWQLRRMVSLPCLRDLEFPDLVDRISGSIGTCLFSPPTVAEVLAGWACEAPCQALQLLGRAFERGASVEEAAEAAGVHRNRAGEIHRFLGVAEMREQTDLHIAAEALRAGVTKRALREQTGWGDGKWLRMTRAARQHLAAEEVTA